MKEGISCLFAVAKQAGKAGNLALSWLEDPVRQSNLIFSTSSLITTAMIVMKSSHEMSVDSLLILAAVALLQRRFSTPLLVEFDIVEIVDRSHSQSQCF